MKYQKIIKDLRHELYLTQTDVAKVLNCTQVAYGMYESGKRKLSVENLIKLAVYYDVTTDYILGLTNERKSEYMKKNKKL